jgi:DNA helicase-2/ATP-dependent DNA helicase PcrA
VLDLSALNPPQREAVAHGDGPLLVLAGAGSGKTRVLTYRVAHLLERGWPARAICALSFTNRAADEMVERLEQLCGKPAAEELTASTFHALGLAILKSARPGFVIYDTADQLGVVREVLRAVKVDDRSFDPRAILHRISRAKNAGEVPRPGGDDYDAITALVYPRYQEALAGFHAVDFDDLIVESVRALDGPAAATWGRRFRFVLVDEYQDTNRAQLEMLRRLCGAHANVTAVGDDDQSIYAWRGAEAANILAFEEQFPGARIVKLEQNYRSTPTILAAANAVIRNNAARHAKQLWSDRGAGDKLVLAVAPDADGEAKFVCDEIERLRLDERRRLSEIAILYRANVQARAFEEALHGRRIPLVMHGGQQFYERKEVKDVIAYLKLALNPRDEISLRRIVNYPARGIGAATVERAAAWAAARGAPLWDALVHAGEIPGIGPAARAAIGGFVALVGRTRAAARQSGARAADALVSEIRLYDDLRAGSTSALVAQRRVDHVADLLRSLAEREQRAPGVESLREYLHFLSLHALDDDDAEDGKDRVTMTTLHGAKGLEWPVVFLVGVEEELLPHARTLYPQGPDTEPAPNGASPSPREGDISEERRLAYVGITRARERLYLSRALARHKHGRDRPRTASRFLDEIPAELVDRRDLLAEARAPVAKQELRGFFQALLKEP